MSDSNNIQIQFHYLDIENCFKNFYVVPDYQREYVWEERQVNQLLQDVYEEFDNNPNKEYFIGSTVVYKTKDAFFELIDGQQRTTTLFLIICAFKTLYGQRGISTTTLERMIKDQTVNAEGDDVDKFKLELQYDDSSNVLIDISNDKKRNTPQIGSALRLFNAYGYIVNFLNNNFDITTNENIDEETNNRRIKEKNDQLKKFFVYVYRKLKFIQIETPEINDALKIFETINERGVGLNPMDLLKNLIFRQVSREDFGKIKDRWKVMVKKLEKHKEKPLRFLRYFLMANYQINNTRGDGILREDEIYPWITNADNAAQCNYVKQPFEFVELLNQNLDSYIQFFNGRDKNGTNVYLNNISKLGGGSFRQHLVILLAIRDLPSDLFNHLAKQLEVLIFYYFINRVQAKVYERNFSKWSSILKKINTKEDLNQFLENYLIPEVKSMEADFATSFEQLNYNSLQRYRLRYILAKITQYTDQERLGAYVPQTLDAYITKGIEIEHILPETPEQELLDTFGEDYEIYKNKLGNLTLLEKSINASIGNGDYFTVKVKEYTKSQFYLTKSLAILEDVGNNTAINRLNKKLKSYEEWNRESIINRQQLLFELANEIWKVGIKY